MVKTTWNEGEERLNNVALFLMGAHIYIFDSKYISTANFVMNPIQMGHHRHGRLAQD